MGAVLERTSLASRANLRVICVRAAQLILPALLMSAPSLLACSGGGDDPGGPDAGTNDGSTPTGAAFVTYSLGGQVFAIADEPGAAAQNLSATLVAHAIQGGEDQYLNVSPNGAWFVLASERFHADCDGWSCLSVVPASLGAPQTIIAGGGVLHPEGHAAVSSDGTRVVYAGTDGPHGIDLYLTTRAGTAWSAPQLLTPASASSHEFHDWPAFSSDGTKLLMTCGAEVFDSRGICEVGVDGGGFRTVLAADHVPPGQAGPAVSLHHPDYGPNGSIVFEGDWGGERIWRLSAGASEPESIGEFSNDNTPCVLANGRIASLWLNRPENSEGVHELKTMAADGTQPTILVPLMDVSDFGLGCAN